MIEGGIISEFVINKFLHY